MTGFSVFLPENKSFPEMNLYRKLFTDPTKDILPDLGYFCLAWEGEPDAMPVCCIHMEV